MISSKYPTFIIAEAGSNHDGNFKQACQLVDIAVAAGADAVKFQIFKADKLYTQNCGTIKLNGHKLDLYKFLEASEVNYDWIPKLNKYCNQKNIIFLATPFDERSADILAKNKVKAFKIASSELNHLPLLGHIARKNRPLIMSDGLSTLSDMEEAINAVLAENNSRIIVLHCVSSYPAPPEEYNLNFIKTITEVFGVTAGVSDHTSDPILIPTLAVCNGARVIEKHFTISKKLKGADHFFALEPQELKLMVKKIREVEKYSEVEKKNYLNKYPKILGSYRKIITPSEKEIYPGDKRSIFSIKGIKMGEKFSVDNIRILRAERFLKPGLHPRYWNLLMNKTCQKNILKFRGIQWENIIK